MALSEDLLKKTNAKKVLKELLDNKAEHLVKKGADISTAELYNLCLINRERDEIIECPTKGENKDA